MKEITRISLASFPYNVEVEAKKDLEVYLGAIKKSLGADADAMREIEARIVELLTDRDISGEKVIGTKDIDAVKAQLGDPNDFTDSENTPDIAPVAPIASEKRLMRDSSSAMVAGVCAGLAAYFGVDVVWIRLAFILAAVMSAGMMILAYIAAWVVIPISRTAANRLQMAGRPVTLASIQDESDNRLPRSETAGSLLAGLRIISGIAAVAVGVIAAMSVVMVIWHVLIDTDARLDGIYWLYGGLIAAAGLLFVFFCWVIAYMLLTAKHNKRLIGTLVTVVTLGLLCFGVGAGMGYVTYRQERGLYDQRTVIPTTDMKALSGKKQLKIEADGPVVLYHVSLGVPKAVITYSPGLYKNIPTVTLDGDTIRVSAATTSCVKTPLFCSAVSLATVDIYGPPVDTLTVVRGNVYIPATNALVVNVIEGDVVMSSETQVDTITLMIGRGARVDATAASIGSLKASLSESSSLEFGIVRSLDITAPDVCSSVGAKTKVSGVSAKETSINTKPLGSVATPCLEVMITNNQPS